MKCELKFQDMPKDYPKDEVDVYRVVRVDNTVYFRLEFLGKPLYFTLNEQELVTHSRESLDLFKDLQPDDCSPVSVLREAIYEMIYLIGEKRNELYSTYEKLFEEAIIGKPIEGTEVVKLRKSAYQLFSDATVLYFVVRKLTKELGSNVEVDAKFALDRAELLITRLSDLYNIYYTRVQYDLNDVIKKLTSVSILFLPITAVASTYAVNFTSIAESLFTVDALVFLGPVFVFTAVIAYYLKRKGWL